MKKELILMSLIFVIFEYAFSEHVPVGEAELVAKNWFHFFLKKSNSDVKDVTIYNKNENIVFYIFSFNSGYVIVSADNSVSPILAYSVSHSYSKSNDFPLGHYALLDDYAEQIEYAIINKINNNNTKFQWMQILENAFEEKEILEPLIKSKWGQGLSHDRHINAYSFYCPQNDECDTIKNCEAGCVAVAMAQVMKYWAYPGAANRLYEWCNMPDSLMFAGNPNYEVQRDAIAHLIRDCGTAVDMQYCNSAKQGDACESLAWVNDECWAMEGNFKFSDDANVKKRYWHPFSWEQMLKDDLDSGYPILYSALSSGKSDEKGGHTFIVDGYQGNHFHINWGWRGAYDDWYTLTYLSPTGTYNFNLAHRAIFNLHPENLDYCEEIENLCDQEGYTSYTTIVSGTVLSKDKYECPEFGGSIWPPLQVAYIGYTAVKLRQGFHVRSGAGFLAKRLGCHSGCRDFQQKSFYKVENKSRKELLNFSSIEKEVILFPNPVINELHIEFENEISDNPYEIKIFDILGNIVSVEMNIKPTERTIIKNVDDLQQGVYILKIKSDTFSEQFKFFKQ